MTSLCTAVTESQLELMLVESVRQIPLLNAALDRDTALFQTRLELGHKRHDTRGPHSRHLVKRLLEVCGNGSVMVEAALSARCRGGAGIGSCYLAHRM